MSTLVTFILALVMEFITPFQAETQVSTYKKETCSEISHSINTEEEVTTLIIC